MTDIVPLGEVVKIRYGFSFPASDFSDKGIPVIRMSDLQDYVVDTSNAVCVPEHYWDKLEGYRILKGDLIIGMSGSVGKLGIYNDDKPALQNQRVGVFVVKSPKEIDRDYLKYFAFTLEEKLLEISKGVAVKNVSAEEIESFRFPLPPLTEQKRIASLLARADRLRQLRRTADNLGDALLQSLFLEMFGDALVNDKGWDVVKLSEAFAIKPQIGTPNPAHDGGKYLVVRVGEIGNKKVDLESSQRITLDGKELERFRLRTGDFLLARAIGSEDHLGKASILQNINEVVVYDSHVMRLRFDPKIMSPVFFWHWLKSDGGRARFMQRAGRTAVQFNVNTEQIADINIPLPPLSLQEEFAGVVARVESLRGRMGESTRQVEGLFDALLAQTMDGGR